MTGAGEMVAELFTYKGKRADAKGKLFHCLHRQGAVDESWYPVRKAQPSFSIGWQYRIEWDPSSSSARLAGAVMVGVDGTIAADLFTHWRASDAAARAFVAELAAAKRADTENDLEEALDLLCRAYSKIRAYDQRAGLLAYFTARITGLPRRKER